MSGVFKLTLSVMRYYKHKSKDIYLIYDGSYHTEMVIGGPGFMDKQIKTKTFGDITVTGKGIGDESHRKIEWFQGEITKQNERVEVEILPAFNEISEREYKDWRNNVAL